MPDLSKMTIEELLKMYAAPDFNTEEDLRNIDQAIIAELTRRTEVPVGHVKLDDGRVYEIIKWEENTDRPIYGTAMMLGEIVVVARPAALAAKGVEGE